jgi:hypothetical protein
MCGPVLLGKFFGSSTIYYDCRSTRSDLVWTSVTWKNCLAHQPFVMTAGPQEVILAGVQGMNHQHPARIKGKAIFRPNQASSEHA